MTGPREGNRRIALVSKLIQFGFFAGLVGFWFVISRIWHVNPILLPDPGQVWEQFVVLLWSGAFWPDLQITLYELLAAFGISVIAGTVTGYLVSRSRFAIRVFEPLFSSIFAIPIILFLPLYVLIFGLGPASKIALGTTISFFPITLSTIAGFKAVDPIHITAARSMGANNLQMFRHVLIPAALPVVVSGMRIGFTIALLSIVGSEAIASLGGLGHRIVNLAEIMNMPLMFAYIAFVIAIAVTLNLIVSRIEQRAGHRQ